MNVIITELQNRQSTRNGTELQVKNLTAAKRAASRSQMFQGTVLQIAAPNGAILSRKENGDWTDVTF